MEFANTTLETLKGTDSLSWKKEAGKFILNVEVPFNTAANVFIPGDEKAEIQENGVLVTTVEGVKYIGYSNGAHQLIVQSGSYSFSVL